MDQFDHRSGHLLEIDGADIYYEVVGQEGAPALLLLHGGFGNMEDFNVILPGLTERFRVIGVDSRGHGRSTLGGAPLTYGRLQEDVERLVSQLRLDSYSILGFSDGGIVVYRMASRAPQAIEALVTVGASWELEEDDPVREILSQVTAEGWRKKFPSTYDSYQELNPEPDFDAFAASVVKMWLDSGPSGYPGSGVEKIACRTLVTRGEDDHLVPRETLLELARRVRGAKVLDVPGAGHAAFQDQPERFLRILSEFLTP